LKNRKVHPEQIAIKVHKTAELLELTDSLDVRPGNFLCTLRQLPEDNEAKRWNRHNPIIVDSLTNLEC
jgi:hypothetical protein